MFFRISMAIGRASLHVSMLLLVLAGLLSTSAYGDPVWGREFDILQPDGTTVRVKIWGDEFYRIVESLDGYSVTQDPDTSFVCYARPAPDGTALVSSGIPVGKSNPASLGIVLHVRPSPAAVAAQIQAAKDALADTAVLAPAGIPAAPDPVGSVRGLCLLIDFPDVPGTITPAEVNNFWNQVGYTGNSNNGSVRDYFYDVSGHQLTYTNYVPAAYFRASHSQSYYNDTSISFAQRAQELIREALNSMASAGFDFTAYDADHDGRIDALNCLYAGNRPATWSTGLWPHRSALSFTAPGISVADYEITDMGSALVLSTVCHENGHLACHWPDLYDYSLTTQGYNYPGVGGFCLMGTGGSNGRNPVQPCAYLKKLAGWATLVPLTDSQAGLSAAAGAATFYTFSRPGYSNEYFIIENRQQSGRDAGLPDSGLAIWHIDTLGNQTYHQRTATQHYVVSLEQADGRFDLENSTNYGDSTDLWISGGTFGSGTNPNSNWWNGTSSTMAVSGISAAGATMTFNVLVGEGLAMQVTPSDGLVSAGSTGGPFSPTSKTYTITNNGTSSLTWTAAKTQSWISLNSTGGTLAAGANTTVTVSINSSANSLATSSGAYTDTITFTNTTNGSGNTTRSVRLAVTTTTAPIYVNSVSGNDTWNGLAATWNGTHGPKRTIQAGIDTAGAGGTVTLASGTYAGTGNRDLDFKGKAITVQSTNPNDPAVVAATAIDCQASASSIHRGFYFHTNETSTSVVTGLTIINGYTDSGGGAIRLSVSSPTIRKCVLRANTAFNNGGAISCYQASPMIVDCTFTNNSSTDPAGAFGGAICCWTQANPTILRCAFSGNYTTGYGGAIYGEESNTAISGCTFQANRTDYLAGGIWCSGGTTTISNCTLTANRSAQYGGALSFYGATTAVTISNCLLSANTAGSIGGAIFEWNSCSPTLIGCTLAANNTDNGGNGTAMYSDGGTPTFRNCLIWGNGGSTFAYVFRLDGGCTPAFTYSLVQGGSAGTGNLNVNPLFQDAVSGNYRLALGSPCTNTGDPAYVPSGAETDLDSRTRLLYGRVDMGAYEYRLPGDANLDRYVNVGDLQALVAAWGGTNTTTPPTANWNANADYNNDSYVNVGDLQVLVANWGKSM